ncbi:MAG TPA: O-methyltransferase [Dongiaceae bacterium]|nr:O-methyltransferase [Dongiaceae bacterium]
MATRDSLQQPTWTAVDDYLTDLLLGPDPALAAARAASAAAGLPDIAVSPPQGKMLFLLARLQGARAILEIGTLGGYSAIWLARALPPGGRLITLEADPRHAEVARANIARAGLAGAVDVRCGRALDTLPSVAKERGAEGFDLIFIDADKTGYPDYWDWALRLSHRGTLIVADNVVRDGAVADPASADASVLAVRRYHELVAAEPRVTATTIQTVGIKGYDGLSFALVVQDPAR